MSEITNIADALVEALNAEIDFLEAQRVYRAELDRKDLKGQQVLVVPFAERDEFSSRGDNESEFDIQIIILRPANPEDPTTDIDDGLRTVELIKKEFRNNGTLREQAMGGAQLSAMANDPLWDSSRLNDGARFVSAIQLTYNKFV